MWRLSVAKKNLFTMSLEYLCHHLPFRMKCGVSGGAIYCWQHFVSFPLFSLFPLKIHDGNTKIKRGLMY